MEFIQNYELPISLWSMIMENVAPNELDEVKSFLGKDLVDQSIELRSEISTLLDIYKSFSYDQAGGDCAKQFLPEPPEVRERLLKEIKFFVTSIRDQAHLQGRNPDKILANHPSDIIDYAYESSSSSRPTTSNDSYISTSRSSYRATPISDRVNISLLKEKLNYMEFEDVQSNLRQFLQEEVNQLSTDLTEIHNLLYNDDVDRCHSRISRHTISELKQERHELEQILLQSSRPLSKSSSKISQTSSRTSRKSIGETSHDTNHSMVILKSPPKLKPIMNNNKSSTGYVKSPLDIDLPEMESPLFQDFTDTNNSSVFTKDFDNFTITKSQICQKSFSDKPVKFNSAQKFRQKVLQNRKETLPN